MKLPELMPLTDIALAWAHAPLWRPRERVVKSLWLRPDAKCQVTVEYAFGRPMRADTIVLSTQHAPEISQSEIRCRIIDFIRRDEDCGKWVDEPHHLPH